MKLVVTIGFAFLVIGYGTSCKKAIEPGIPMNAELKQYFNFQIGSYWVFKDSSTGIMDSIWVTYNTYLPNDDPGQQGKESIGIGLKELIFKPTGTDTMFWNYHIYLNNFDVVHGPKDSITFFATLITFPFKLGEIPLFDSGTVTNIYPNYLVNGTTYTQVAEVHHANPVSHYDDWFYLTDSLGIIKRRTNENALRAVWELQSFHITR